MTKRFLFSALVAGFFLFPILRGRCSLVCAEWDFSTNGGFYDYIQPFYANNVLGQTFLARTNGTLVDIEVTIGRAAFTAMPVRFQIRPVWNSGLNGIQPDMRPGAPVLSTGILLPGDPQFAEWGLAFKTVPMSPVALSAGTTYGIVATALGTDQVYQWWTQYGGAGYSDGQLFIGGQHDTVLVSQQSDVGFIVNVVTNPAPLPTAYRTPIQNPTTLASGAFQLEFTNAPGLNITVLATNNPALPPGQWPAIGTATEASPGVYQFIDSGAPDYSNRLYRLRYP